MILGRTLDIEKSRKVERGDLGREVRVENSFVKYWKENVLGILKIIKIAQSIV